jgi:Uma2 family endonuclease
MATHATKHIFTVDDLDAMPDDGNRYEIIDGELFVTPPPSWTHQRAQARLAARLLDYAYSIGLDLFMAPADVRASLITQVEPDMLAVQRIVNIGSAPRFVAMPELLLAVEILSPSTQRVDRTRKRDLYMCEGVRDYWIIDAAARAVEVWVPDAPSARIETDALQWHPVPRHPPLEIDVHTMFDEIHA